MKQIGSDPWVAHFFVFLLSAPGGVSPPTSRRPFRRGSPKASFLRTMYEALKICAPITLMAFAIFTRYNMIRLDANHRLQPGADDTIGVTFAMFGRCHRKPVIDIQRVAVAAISFVVMFHPDMRTSGSVAIVVTIAVVVGIHLEHNDIAPPKTFAIAETDAAPSSDLVPSCRGAKRDIG